MKLNCSTGVIRRAVKDFLFSTMRLFFYLVYSILLLYASNLSAQTTQGEWKVIGSIPEDSVYVVHRFIFADSLHGYLYAERPGCEFQGINGDMSYRPYILYRTLDGGKTWDKINLSKVYGSDTTNYEGNASTACYPGTFEATTSNAICLSSPGYPTNDTLKFYWSENNGTSWARYPTLHPIVAVPNDFAILSIPHDKDIIALRRGADYDFPDEKNIGKLAYSVTGGIVFDDIRGDNTFVAYSNGASGGGVGNGSFDYFDDSTWVLPVADTINDKMGIDSTKPYSLVTLLSQDKGYSWQAYPNIIPHLPSCRNINFHPQCMRGTSNIYAFTGATDGGMVYNQDSHNFGFPDFGVNYIFSSDYGKSWSTDTSWGKNRRGRYAVAPGEVWCTAVAHDSVTEDAPAKWIVHTTDFGKTWDIDSTSLFNDGFYDARVITFTDKNHGWIYAQPLDRSKILIFKYFPRNKEGTAFGVIPLDYFYKVYPNPANDITTIELTNRVRISDIEFFDIFGRKHICAHEIEGDAMTAHIHTDKLLSGCYLAHISFQKGNYVVPFIVQH